MGACGQYHTPADLPPHKNQYPCILRWLGPRVDWTGAENLALTGVGSSDVQPVASRYTDWATPAHIN